MVLLYNRRKISFFPSKSMQMIVEYVPLAFPFYYENIHPLVLRKEKVVTERWFPWQTSRLSILQFFLLQAQMLLRLYSAVSLIWKGIFFPYRLLVLLIHWTKYPCSSLQTEGFLWQWLMATLSQEEWLTPTCEYWRRYGIYLLYYLFWEADMCPHFYSWNKHSDIFWQVWML